MSDFPQPIEHDVLPKAVMDYCTLAVIGKVASDLLTGGRLIRVVGMPNGDMILAFDRFNTGTSGRKQLPSDYDDLRDDEFNNWYLSADPLQYRIHPYDDRLPDKSTQSHLVDVASHHLNGARLDDVTVTLLERIITFTFSRRDLTGESSEYRLIAELMGKYSNIILVSSDNIILATFKPVHSFQSRVREVRAGKTYIPPPRQDRIEPREFSESEWADFIGSAGPDISVERHIARTFQGMSLGWASKVAMRAGLDPEKPVVGVSSDEAERLRLSLKNVTEQVGMCKPLTGESVVEFVRRAESDFIERSEDFEIDRARTGLMSVIEKRRKKLTALAEGLIRDLERASMAETYKKKADLLLANLHNIQPASKFLEVEDWETGEKVRIELDPYATPQIQAEGWYERYRKLKRTAGIASERRNAVLAEEEELRLIENRASAASSLDEIREVRQQCVLHGLISEHEKLPRARERDHRREQQKSKPVIGGEIRSDRYRSNDGFLIVAGLNDRANDALRRASSGEDIWLHTRDIPGGHVYIITRGKEVPETTLREAAMVAAWHSQARDGSNVPVDYTKARYITPVAGGPAGKVIFKRERTIRVTPDEKRIELMRLMAGTGENVEQN